MNKYNAFISYASEDLESFVLPLVHKLTTAGLKIWFDKFCLMVGDSIREKIDLGLNGSIYGIVVLSPNFIAKHFPTKELNALFNREIDGEKVILPVWKDLSRKDVIDFSPMLVDRYAAISTEGIDVVTKKLLDVIDPDKNALCESLLLEWSKLERAASNFLKERPILSRERIVSGPQAISDLITEGYVKDKIANDIIAIREIYYMVFHEQNNYKDYVDLELIERLKELIKLLEVNIELKEGNLYLE